MLEVRGIADYEKFSHLSGKNRRGEGDGAEFSRLMHAGEDGIDARAVPDIRSAAESDLVSESGREAVTYDPFGRLSLRGVYIGRNLNVSI